MFLTTCPELEYKSTYNIICIFYPKRKIICVEFLLETVCFKKKSANGGDNRYHKIKLSNLCDGILIQPSKPGITI